MDDKIYYQSETATTCVTCTDGNKQLKWYRFAVNDTTDKKICLGKVYCKSADYKSISKDDDTRECVKECSSNIYVKGYSGINDNYCLPNETTCTQDHTFPELNKTTYCEQCGEIQYIDTTEKGQICIDKCSEGTYKFVPASSSASRVCVQDCSSVNNKWILNDNNDQQCNDNSECSDTYKYQIGETDQCAKSCAQLNPAMFVSADNSSICVADCTFDTDKKGIWYLDGSNEMICTKNISCPPDNQPTFKYVQDEQCAEKCTGKYAKPLEEGNTTCITSCTYYISADGESICITDCDTEHQFYVETDSRKQCFANCSETIDYLYQNDKQCVANCGEQYQIITDTEKKCVQYCTGDYAKKIDTQDKVCDNSCDYYATQQENVCTEKDCDSSRQFYILKTNSRKQCLVSCSDEDGYLYQSSSNECLTACDTDKVWIVDITNNSKICTQNTQCSETVYKYYQTIQPKECYRYCSQLNTEQIQYYQSANNQYECNETCGDNIVYRAVKVDEQYDDFRCDITEQCDYTLVPPEYQVQDKLLCETCPSNKRYVYNNECMIKCYQEAKFIKADSQLCVESCNDNVYYFTFQGYKCLNTNQCSEKKDEEDLPYYSVENSSECIKPKEACNKIQNTLYSYVKDNKEYSCKIVSCDETTTYYKDQYSTQDMQCLEYCDQNVNFIYTNIQKYNNNYALICTTQDQVCPPQHPDSSEYDYKNNLVKYYQYPDDGKSATVCIASCKEIQIYLKNNQSLECIEQCDLDDETLGVSSYENNELICRNESACKEGEFVTVPKFECIKQTQACFDQFSLNFKKVGQQCIETQCDKHNQFLVNKYDKQQIECQEECNEGIYFYYQIQYQGLNEYVQICQEQQTTCPPAAWEGSDSQYLQTLNKLDGSQCTEQCMIASLEESNVCVQSCQSDTQILQLNENYVFDCVSIENQCQGQKKFEFQIMKYSMQSAIECQDTCSEMIFNYIQYYQKSETEENICVDHCPGYTWKYNQEETEKICSECEELYVLDDTHQCIELTDGKCPEEDSGKYIKDEDKKQCKLADCEKQDYYYENQYKSDGNNKCYSKCIGVWIYDQDNRRICRLQDTTCPPTVLDGDNETYIKSLTKLQVDQCVDQCYQFGGKYQYGNYYMNYDNENICQEIDECKYDRKVILQNKEFYVYCDYNKGCDEFEQNKVQQFHWFDNDDRLVTAYMCVSECKSGIWYQYHNQKQCIDQCGDNAELFTIELSQKECSQYNNEECKQLYHIEVDQYNTKCQYIEDAQDCSQFENHGGYIYQYEDTKLCTTCDKIGQQKKIVNDINKCDVVLSTGGIVGVSLAIVTVMVIIIISAIICCKKHKKQAKDIEMKRETKIQ